MGWKIKLMFDTPFLVEDSNKMALMKLHLISRKCLMKLFDLKNRKKVPTKFHPNGSYVSSTIKKVNYNSIQQVTKFRGNPVYVITSTINKKQILTVPTFDNKIKQI